MIESIKRFGLSLTYSTLTVLLGYYKLKKIDDGHKVFGWVL